MRFQVEVNLNRHGHGDRDSESERVGLELEHTQKNTIHWHSGTFKLLPRHWHCRSHGHRDGDRASDRDIRDSESRTAAT
jgi:hypothetical protein